MIFCCGRRPKGTGFLKFKTKDATSSAVSAGSAASGLGIFLKGRQLVVLQALDKKSAHEKEENMVKKEDVDLRNLYLAKVFTFRSHLLSLLYLDYTHFFSMSSGYCSVLS